MKKPGFTSFEVAIAAAILVTLILVGVRIVRLYQTDWPAVLQAMTVADWCFAIAALLLFIGVPILKKKL